MSPLLVKFVLEVVMSLIDKLNVKYERFASCAQVLPPAVGGIEERQDRC
jgi:hypothetical protein